MHGRVFAIKHIENQCVEVQASFGGLLLRLRGEQAHLELFTMDMTLVDFYYSPNCFTECLQILHFDEKGRI